jgi:hypothetical protein
MYTDTYSGRYESISTFTDPNFVKKRFAASPRFIGTPSFCSRESLVCNEAIFFSYQGAFNCLFQQRHSRGKEKCLDCKKRKKEK